MPAKQILFHDRAWERILAGVNILADAVQVTLGPRSRNVLMQQSWGGPVMANSGVVVARTISPICPPSTPAAARALRAASVARVDVVSP